MEEPTQEQREKFWLKLDFNEEYEGDTNAWWVKAPDGKGNVDYPPIDLNNLFKYAVPKIHSEGYYVHIMDDMDNWVVEIIENDNHYMKSMVRDKDLALALFWAIWEVIKDGE